MKRHLIVASAALGFLFGSGANAANFIILSSSTMNDVRKIGAANIPEIADYSTCIAPSTCSGTLDPTDPASWPLLDKDITTYPYIDPSDPTHAVGIELNNINVSGTLSFAGGSVTAATVNQLGALGYITWQSSTVQNNLVSGDTTLLNNDPLSGTVVKSVLSNPMVWVYNPVTNQLNHQAGGGTAATSASIATCVPVVGTGISGQCRQLAGQIDASGELGGTTIANSIWNWDGMGANYIVRDSQTLPWHTGTGTGTTGGLQISGASGHQGVTWDLNGCTESSMTCTIYARVVAAAVANGGTANATGMTALYTFELQNTVPVPAAVWMLGGALGLLGVMRRRQVRA